MAAAANRSARLRAGRAAHREANVHARGVDARHRPRGVVHQSAPSIRVRRGAAGGVLALIGLRFAGGRRVYGVVQPRGQACSCATSCSIRWHLTGDEKVLDVGCGRGLLLIGAAKRLKSGKATGIDVWDASVLPAIRRTRPRPTPSSKASRIRCASRRAMCASWFIRRRTTTWWCRPGDPQSRAIAMDRDKGGARDVSRAEAGRAGC